MGTGDLIDIARRKERLIVRAEHQRAVIAACCLRWGKPVAMIDRGLAIVRYLKAHPLALALAVSATAVVGRRHLWRWAGRGWMLWRFWRSASGWGRRTGA